MGAQDAARCDTVRDLRTVPPAAVVRRRLQALAQSLKIVRRQKRSAARQSGGVAAFECSHARRWPCATPPHGRESGDPGAAPTSSDAGNGKPVR